MTEKQKTFIISFLWQLDHVVLFFWQHTNLFAIEPIRSKQNNRSKVHTQSATPSNVFFLRWTTFEREKIIPRGIFKKRGCANTCYPGVMSSIIQSKIVMSPTDIITSIRKHERDSVKPTHQSQHPHPSFVSNMHFLDQSYFRIFFKITSTTKMWWWLVVGGWWWWWWLLL